MKRALTLLICRFTFKMAKVHFQMFKTTLHSAAIYYSKYWLPCIPNYFNISCLDQRGCIHWPSQNKKPQAEDPNPETLPLKGRKAEEIAFFNWSRKYHLFITKKCYMKKVVLYFMRKVREVGTDKKMLRINTGTAVSLWLRIRESVHDYNTDALEIIAFCFFVF